MKTAVFAGPSLHGLDLGPFPDMTVLPPAAAGDLFAAVRQGAEVIGLIDGFYGDCAAVWHKEILHALSQGVAVAGAASMGALRAAECETFGMQGVGEIFTAYRTGLRTSDADVAVIHAPAELAYRPLTIALVDAEAAIDAMRGKLPEIDIVRLGKAARSQHFSRRTWRTVVAEAGLDSGVAGLLADSAVSIKRSDAGHLLDRLQRGEIVPRPASGWTFQNTMFFQSLAARSEKANRPHE